MARKSSKLRTPAPGGLVSARQGRNLDPEEFLVLVEECLESICAGCLTPRSKRSPYQVVAAVKRELAALRDLVEAGELSVAERRIRSADGWRLRRPELAEALLVEARAALPGNPTRSSEWATLARAAASLDTTPLHVEREAQALAYFGNARRALSDLSGAEKLFQEARQALQRSGTATPVIGADIDVLESSLARDRRSLDRAEALLRRALMVQLAEGLALPAARTLISLSTPYFERGDISTARQLLLSALPAIEAEGSRSLHLLALLNLCLCEVRDEKFGTASERLGEIDSMIEDRDLDSFTALRITWLQARVAAGLGDDREALDLFRQVFGTMLSVGAVYDALLVALDWMRLATRLGEEEDIRFLVARFQMLSGETPELRDDFHEILDLLTKYLLEGAFTEAVYWIFERCLWRRRAV